MHSAAIFFIIFTRRPWYVDPHQIFLVHGSPTLEQGAIGILPTGKPSFAVPMSNMAEFQMPALWKSKQLAIALTGKADAE